MLRFLFITTRSRAGERARRIGTIAMFLFASTAACAVATPRRPELPVQIATQDEARKIAEAYKLICTDSECSRADGTYRLDEAFKLAAGYRAPTDVVSSFYNTREYIAGPLGAASLVALAFAYGLDLQADDPLLTLDEQASYEYTSIQMYLIGLGLSAAALVVYLVMPEPDEEFAAAYNDALEKDIAARVASKP